MGEVPNSMNAIEDGDYLGNQDTFDVDKLYDEVYKGFSSTSVRDAHKKGFILGVNAMLKIEQERNF